jgi:hypothetical protein
MESNNIEKEIRNIEKLKTLANSDKKSKRNIILRSDKEFINIIKDCILNVLNGNIKLCESKKNKLKNHKYTLRKILQTRQANQNKKLLVQKGGSFLPLILPGAISLLTTIIDLVNQK